ncbi:integrase [Gossypium australe]|uniref:Integrase n=1 Tax=Gossypium australe TaxID=47621 RepID=A0A5B6VBW9_9ROSI|nr:integrase [Gossypium australe]
MYNDLKQLYWWSSMKRDISEFVSRYLVCQQVKVEHQVPLGLLQPVMIPEWKWDRVSMDFITGLPLSPKNKNAIWVVVDRLTTHFYSVCSIRSCDLVVWHKSVYPTGLARPSTRPGTRVCEAILKGTRAGQTGMWLAV